MSEKLLSFGFNGGINQAVDYSLIKPVEAKEAYNIDIGRGNFAYSLYWQNIHTYGSNTVNTMPFYDSGTWYFITAYANGDLIKTPLDFSSSTTIYTGLASSTFDYVNNNYYGNDVIVMTNGTNDPLIYDGTTCVKLKKDGHDSTAGGTNIAPRGSMVDLHYERLWIANDNELFASKDLDIEDFTTPTDETQVNQHGAEINMYSNDGSKIIGFKVIFDDLVIFKTTSIFKIFGSSPANYQKIKLFSSNGAIADKSIVNTNKGAFFLNRDGIHIYDGTNVALISQKINGIIKLMSPNYASQAVGCHYNDKYYVTIPTGDTTSYLVEYNLSTKTFMVYNNVNVKCFIEVGNDLYFVTEGNTLCKLVSSYNANTATCTMTWKSGVSDMGEPNAVKEIETIYLTSKGTGTVNVILNTEKGSKTTALTINSSEYQVYKANVNHVGRILGIEVNSNTANGYVEIADLKLLVDIDYD